MKIKALKILSNQVNNKLFASDDILITKEEAKEILDEVDRLNKLYSRALKECAYLDMMDRVEPRSEVQFDAIFSKEVES